MNIGKETRQRDFGPPKYIPNEIYGFVGGRATREPVIRVESAPLGNGKVRVTAYGASGMQRHWTGSNAYIDASLRFVIVGYHGIEAGYWEDPE